MTDSHSLNSEGNQKARRIAAIDDRPEVSLIDSTTDDASNGGPVLVADDTREATALVLSAPSGGNEDPTGAAVCQPLVEKSLPELPVRPLESEEKARKKRSFLAACGMSILKLCASLAVLTVVIAVWGNQIVDSVDDTLKRDPYTYVPVGKLIKPLLQDDNRRPVYLDALRSFGDGLARQGTSFFPNSSLNAYQRALTDLEKIGANGHPLYAMTLMQISDAEARTRWNRHKAEPDYQLAIQLLSDSTDPRNRLVAAAERQAAAFYVLDPSGSGYARAERCIKRAIEIDTAGGGKISDAMLQNQILLARLYDMQGSPEADQAWRDLVEITGKVYGEKTYSYARTLLDYSIRLVDRGELVRSIESADKAAEILLATSGNQIEWHNWMPSISTDNGALGRYLKAAHTKPFSSAVANAPPGTTVDSIRQSLALLDNKFLTWHCKKNTPKSHFNMQVTFADQYNSGTNFGRADQLYKGALNFVLDSKRTGFNSRRIKSLDANLTSSDRYVLCMAKTARNCMQMNNVHEAAVIAKNCLAITDPYNNWRPEFDYGGAMETLVYTLGPVPDGARTAELREVTETLDKRLEHTYRRSDILARRNAASPWKSSVMLRAELAELQGRLRDSEQFYKLAVLNAENATTCGALGAFYLKNERYGQAADLLAKSENLFVRERQSERSTYAGGENMPTAPGTVVNLARLKQLTDAVPNKERLRDLIFYKKLIDDTARAKTSLELGRRHYILELRPVIHSFVKTGETGTIYYMGSARKDLSSLPKEKEETAKRLFKWYQMCFPQSAEARAKLLLVESLPLNPLPGMPSKPMSPAALVPMDILLISEEDQKQMEQLLGRRLGGGSDVVQ